MKSKNILMFLSVVFISACSSMTYTTKQETTEKNKPLVTEIKCVLIDACNAKAKELCEDIEYSMIKVSVVREYLKLEVYLNKLVQKLKNELALPINLKKAV